MSPLLTPAISLPPSKAHISHFVTHNLLLVTTSDDLCLARQIRSLHYVLRFAFFGHVLCLAVEPYYSALHTSRFVLQSFCYPLLNTSSLCVTCLLFVSRLLSFNSRSATLYLPTLLPFTKHSTLCSFRAVDPSVYTTERGNPVAHNNLVRRIFNFSPASPPDPSIKTTFYLS